eukprot:5296308-Amphidinium_carterae.1
MWDLLEDCSILLAKFLAELFATFAAPSICLPCVLQDADGKGLPSRARRVPLKTNARQCK